jgi:hypothetical protein
MLVSQEGVNAVDSLHFGVLVYDACDERVSATGQRPGRTEFSGEMFEQDPLPGWDSWSTAASDFGERAYPRKVACLVRLRQARR